MVPNATARRACLVEWRVLLQASRPGANGHTSCTRITLDITIEASLSSTCPIGSFVVVDPRSRTQEAEKDVARRSDDNSDVPAPHHQIARLRPHNSSKPFDSDVEIGGTGVGVGETGSFVYGMNEMGTVALRI